MGGSIIYFKIFDVNADQIFLIDSETREEILTQDEVYQWVD